MVNEYKKFFLISCVSDVALVPSGAIDEVWHMHMNFAKNYFKTCNKNE